MVEDPYQIDFVEDVRLPPPARRLIVLHWAARRRLEKRAGPRRRGRVAPPWHALLGLDVSAKDAGDLLGLPPLKLQKLRVRARV